jgi:uncharacterized YccA/Bax inhibitor family protein
MKCSAPATRVTSLLLLSDMLLPPRHPFHVQYPGIAMNAVLLTFSTAASLFVALRARLITVTDRFAGVKQQQLAAGIWQCHLCASNAWP